MDSSTRDSEKEGQMKKAHVSLATITVLLLTIVFITFPSTASLSEAKPITLNFVSFVPLSYETAFKGFKRMFIDKVHERAKGELVINVRGGPEVIRSFDLGVAVQKGTIDMATIPAAFFESLVPGADSTKLSIYTAWEERENGIYEYIRDMYKKAGFYYLGRGEATKSEYFMLGLNKKVEKPEDFRKLKLGGSTAFHGLYKRLGAKVTTLAIPEYHSALERKVVDGVATGVGVFVTAGLFDIMPYAVGHRFYRSTVAVPINLNTWNKLPKHLQELLTECMAQYEKDYYVFDEKWSSSKIKAAEAKGLKLLYFPPDMANWFLESANEGSWDYAMERFPGDVIPKLRARITQ